MKKEKISEALNFIDEKYVDEAEIGMIRKKKSIIIKITAVAASIAIVLSVGIPSVLHSRKSIPLSDASANVQVYRVDTLPQSVINSTSAFSLAYFETPEELFSSFPLAIFRGTITDIENIKISFNGCPVYRAIAEIKVEKVYQGACKKGEKVKVLLPCTIADGTWTEDCGTVEQFKVGTKGIFMPIAYDDSFIWEQNGATLKETDIAPYGFADGVRYAFIETDNGLCFDRDSHADIENAESLDDVEAYVINMIAKIQ